jgi:hypothetical protein
MARVLTYALEFRGEAAADREKLLKRASATPCSHVTRLGDTGVDSRFVYDDSGEEAFFESRLSLDGDGAFTESGLVDFGHGHELHLRTADSGRLQPSAERELRHGTAVLEVVGGTGQFEGASGRISSNFVLSDTGDLTENQLGLIFVAAPV